jgi:hypothetical protein
MARVESRAIRSAAQQTVFPRRRENGQNFIAVTYKMDRLLFIHHTHRQATANANRLPPLGCKRDDEEGDEADMIDVYEILRREAIAGAEESLPF